MKRIVVFGGNGFVGSQVCRSALALGLDVTSINRSGRPAFNADWVNNVKWVAGDISKGESEVTSEVRDALTGAVGAVSCVGAFGSNETMLQINGFTNVNAMKIAKQAGVERFTYISTGRSTMPSFVLRGYFEGKIMAEKALSQVFDASGIILRPGFIFGLRKTALGDIPLQFVGAPLKLLLELTGLNKLRNWPWMSMPLTLPVHVESVGFAAAASAAGLLEDLELFKKLSDQEAYKYEQSGTIVLETEDVDMIGNLVQRLNEEEHARNNASK